MELCNGPHGGRAPPTVLLRLVLNLPGAIAAFDDCPLVQVFQGRKLVFDTEHDEDAHVSRRRLPSCCAVPRALLTSFARCAYVCVRGWVCVGVALPGGVGWQLLPTSSSERLRQRRCPNTCADAGR